jgi:transcriptional regulator with XRE-family HTH domain
MERLRWDYQKLADEAGLTRSGVYKMVEGHREPSFDNIDRLAGALGRDSGWLFTDHAKPVEPITALDLIPDLLKVDPKKLEMVEAAIRAASGQKPAPSRVQVSKGRAR